MRTIKQRLKLNKEEYKLVKHYCYHSRALYNSALYVCKCFYEETGKYIGFNQLYVEMKPNYHYKEIPAMISQQILRLVDKNYRSFFALLKRKLKGQHSDRINPPLFKKKGSEFILILDNTRVKLRNDELKITKNLKIPFYHKINGTIKQTIIKPRGGKYYELIIQYQENDEKRSVELETKNFLSIDLGLNNFASCYSNVGECFIINGKPLKSYNQNYNKRKAKIQSELKICNDKRGSNKLAKITNNRYNWVNNFMNQSSSFIVKKCLQNNIDTVICGYNKTWKNEISIGKANNQNFTHIPHKNFVEKLKTKCENAGIKFDLQEESYTSKCSFIDNEEVKEHKEYAGKRVKRGLFKTKNGEKINADINGAANIAKKYFGTGFEKLNSEPNRGGIVTPVVFNFFEPNEVNT